MKYSEGNLIMDEDEITMLSQALMSEVETVYPACTLLNELDRMKAEAGEYIQKIESEEAVSPRYSLKIGITRLLIKICETLKDRGYAAARDAGCSIRIH